MSGVSVVGSVGVRVKPVVNKFAEDARKKLRAEEKKLYKPKTSIRVDRVEVDERQLAAARAKIERAFNVDANVQGLDSLNKTLDRVTKSRNFNLGVALRQDNLVKLEKDIDRVVKKLSRDVDINLSDRVTRNSFARLTSEYETLRGTLRGHNPVDLFPEEEYLRVSRRLSEIRDELKETAENRTVRLDVNPFTSWASARLKFLTRPRVAEIIPVVSQSAAYAAEAALARLSGARLGGKYLVDFSKWLKDIDEKLPRAAIASVSVAAGLAAIGASVAGIVAVGNSFVQMSAAALPLPGILAAAGLSVTVFARAWKDINNEIPGIKTGLQDIGETISSNYWAQARESISALADDLIPRFNSRMGLLATAMGVHAAVFADAFRSALANGELELMFQRTIEFWGQLTVGADDFASAIVNLGVIGTAYLPRLGRWISDLTTRFNGWLDAGIKSGRIFNLIEQGITQVKLFGRSIAHVTGILAGFHRAASGAGFTGLEGLTLSLKKWDKAVNGFKWQVTLTDGFKASREAMKHFGSAFRELGETFYVNRDVFNDFTVKMSRGASNVLSALFSGFRRGEFRKSFTEFTTGMAKALKALEPAAAPLTRIIGKVLETVGRLAASIAPVITKLMTAVEPVLIPLLDNLAAISEAITPVIASMADMAGMITGPLGGAIAFLGTVLVGAAVVAKMQALSAAVGGFLTTVGRHGVVAAFGQTAGRAGVQAGAAAGKVGLLARAGGALAAGFTPAALGVAAGVTAVSFAFDRIYEGTDKATVSVEAFDKAIRKGADSWRKFNIASDSGVKNVLANMQSALKPGIFGAPDQLGTVVSVFSRMGKDSMFAADGLNALNIGLANSGAGIKVWGAGTAQALTDLEAFGSALGQVARDDAVQAQQAFSRMLETNKVLPENFNQALASATGYKDALRSLATYAGVASSDSALLRYATDSSAAAYLKAKVSAQEARDALEAYGGSLEGVLGKAAPAVGVFAQLAGEWGNLGSRQRDAALSGYAFQDSLEAMQAKVAAVGLTLDTNTQAGRDNMRMLYDLAGAANQHAEANLNAGASVKDVAEKYASQRDAIYALAAAANLGDVETQALVESLGLIPGDVQTLISTNFKDAAAQADDLKVRATNVAGDYVARFALEHGVATSAVAALSGSLNTLVSKPHTATVSVQTGVAASAVANLAAVKIPDKQFNVFANTSAAIAGVVGVNGAVAGIKDKTVNIFASVTAALTGAMLVRDSLGSIRDRSVTVSALTGTASSRLSGIASQIAGLHSKTITITTVHRSVEARAFGGTVGSGLLGFASGGTIPGWRGGVRNGTVYGAGTSKSDSVVVRLSRGEEVIQEPYASKYRGLLKRINAGGSPEIDVLAGFSRGGTVDRRGGTSSYGVGSNAAVVHIYDVDNRLIGTMDARVKAGVADVSARGLNTELGV